MRFLGNVGFRRRRWCCCSGDPRHISILLQDIFPCSIFCGSSSQDLLLFRRSSVSSSRDGRGLPLSFAQKRDFTYFHSNICPLLYPLCLYFTKLFAELANLLFV